MVKLSTAVALFLGVFEFWMIFKMKVLHDYSSLNDLKVFPPSFANNREVHLLLCTFTLFLGLLRISWAVSGKTVWSWLCVILTHVIEGVFLWNLALLPHWNKNNVALPELVQEIFNKQHDLPSSVLLFLVPGFALFFLLCGPNTSSKRKEKSS